MWRLWRSVLVGVLALSLVVGATACFGDGDEDPATYAEVEEEPEEAIDEAVEQEPEEAVEEEPEQEPEPDDDAEPAAEEPAADTTYVVSGVVYIDLDADGRLTDADTDAPYPGVTVSIVEAATGQVIDAMPTDTEGRYAFNVTEREGGIYVAVAPQDDLVFSTAVLEADPEEFPSGVGAEGKSFDTFMFDQPGFQVNAGLHDIRSSEEDIVVTSGEPLADTSRTSDLFAVDLATGQPVDEPFLPGFTFDVTADESDIILDFDLSVLPEDVTIYVGLDFIGEGLAVTDPVEGFGLTGANFGASAAILNGELLGTTAVIVADEGENVGISTGLQLESSGDQGTLLLPATDIPGGLDSFRVTITDQQTALINGDPAVNGGYQLAAEVDAALGDFLAARGGVPFLERVNQTVVLVPGELAHERTGDQTFQFALDGTVFTTQIDVSSGSAEDRVEQFGDVYDVLDGSEIATDPRTWTLLPLNYQDSPFGALAVADNGSAANPVAIALSAISSTAIDAETLAALETVMAAISPTTQSIYFTVE